VEGVLQALERGFARRGDPPFPVPEPRGLDQEFCMWFVGKPWREAVGELLEDLDCMRAFGPEVFAYYLPAYLVEVAQKGIDPYTGPYDFLDRLLPMLVPGNAEGEAVLRSATAPERAAIAEWVEWVNTETEEYRELRVRNLAFLRG
jgi:hypothetical protein